MLSVFFLFVCSLSNGARSDFNDTMGCRKGYYTISTSPTECKKCSDTQFNDTELEFCRQVTISTLKEYITAGILPFISGGVFNCLYENGKCIPISCPTFAVGMDELESEKKKSYFEEMFDGEDEFRKFCHYHGCMSAYDKGRCSIWAGWAVAVFIIIIVIIIVIVCIVCFCCCRSKTNKGLNTQTQQNYPAYQPISSPQQQISLPQQQTYQQQIYPPQQQTHQRPIYEQPTNQRPIYEQPTYQRQIYSSQQKTYEQEIFPPQQKTYEQQIYPPQQQTYQRQIYPPQQKTYEQQICPPQHQDYAPTPSTLSQSTPGFSAVKDSTWVIPLFAGFQLPVEASVALASDVTDMLRTETFTGKDASRLAPLWRDGYERMVGPDHKGPFDINAIVETVVQMYSLETSLYKEMRQGMDEPLPIQRLSQEVDLAIQALSSKNPTAIVPNIAVKLVMVPLMPMLLADRLAPFAMLLDLALTVWKGPRCGRGTVFHGTQIPKGSIAKRLDAYRHALANNSLVRMSRYISASHNMDVAIEFATKDADRAGRSPILLVIQTQGRPEISAVSMYTGEEEVLFRTNAFMRVTKVGVERGIPAVYLQDCSTGTFTPLSEVDWINLGDLVIMPPSKKYMRNAHTSTMAGFDMGISLMMWLSNKEKGGYEKGLRKQAATLVYYGYNPDVDDDVGRECARAFLSIVNLLRLANRFRAVEGETEMPDSVFPVMWKDEEGDGEAMFEDRFMRWDTDRTLFTDLDTTPGSADYELMDRIFKTSFYWKRKSS